MHPPSAPVARARQLALLGIILQFLHILFGVTGVIGVLITQTLKKNVEGTVYASHLRWQFVTFWIGLTGYACGFYFWTQHANLWVIMAVALVIAYRLIVSLRAWSSQRAITAWF